MKRTIGTAAARRAILAAVLLAAPAAFAGGSVGFIPKWEPGQEPQKVVGMRYKLRVEKNQSPAIKILFVWTRFHNPGRPEVYNLETNLYAYWLQYRDTGAVPWPPKGILHAKESGLWCSVPDYNKKALVGVRPADDRTKAMFPRQSSGVDAIAGVTKIETISQMDMTGKTIAVEIAKGGTFREPLAGWGARCDPAKPGASTETLPAGVAYQAWRVAAEIEKVRYGWEFAFPADSAQYIQSTGSLDLATEFFEQPGLFQAFVWDIEVRREGSDAWEPIRRWKMHYRSDKERNAAYGARLSSRDGKPALEFSNDGTDTYLQLGDVIALEPGARPQHEAEPPAPPPPPPPPHRKPPKKQKAAGEPRFDPALGSG